MRWGILAAVMLLAGSAAAAEPSPYAGDTGRPIKALSPEQVDGLLAGAGLGYARAAELNGYPGPTHVLELAAELGLTPEQAEAATAIRDGMREEAVALGTELVGLEAELDRAFAERSIDPALLADLTGRIAETEGRLRRAHLAAHLETTALLDPHQIHLYGTLRGYDAPAGGQGHGGH